MLSAFAEKPATLLAPNPAELEATEAELTLRVLQSEAVGRAATRLQNAMFYAEDPCADGIATRAIAFGGAWRDTAQRARVQAQRALLIASSETVAPLVDEARLANIASLGERADLSARSWIEFDRIESRTPRGCETVLQPAIGLPAPTPRALGEETAPVAIWVLSGTLCTPGEGPRTAAGVAVVADRACVDLDPSCSCVPDVVLPGAVLTP